jgi:potassium-transporting ATPase potassium-binding subunit
MSLSNGLQYGLFLIIVTALVYPVGGYLQRVFAGERTWLDPVLRPIERGIYRLAGVAPQHEMNWKQYAAAFLLFSLAGTLLLYLILRLQPAFHTFDPNYQPGPLSPDLAMNTAISFATTTTWQAYGGETTLTYFSQIVGLAAQNFLAGAAGLAVGIAFIRGLARQRTAGLGNFWVDVVRPTLWVLLPITCVGTLLLVWQGVPLNFQAYVPIKTLTGGMQMLPQGPVAALEFIKNLGTNGGGFCNVNGAHPYANPTPFANLLGMLAIAVLPAALTNTFGRMVGQPRQGWLLFAVMVVLFSGGLILADAAEQGGNPLVAARGVDVTASANQPGGNLEGKEARFGIGGSILTAITTSNGATGSYNSMHDSYLPLGGMIPLVNMLLGEIVFGGLSSGLYSIIFIALISIFIGGLMVGRTPEYLGKHISVPEMKLIGLYTILMPLVVLVLTGLAVVSSGGLAGLTTNSGPHGFTGIFYAYTSSMANNGQNFAGVSANSPFYNVTLALAMMVGRFGPGIIALALAGRFAIDMRRPSSTGTLPTDSLLFAVLLGGTVLIVGGLSYFPALAMGPMVEHLTLFGM